MPAVPGKDIFIMGVNLFDGQSARVDLRQQVGTIVQGTIRVRQPRLGPFVLPAAFGHRRPDNLHPDRRSFGQAFGQWLQQSFLPVGQGDNSRFSADPLPGKFCFDHCARSGSVIGPLDPYLDQLAIFQPHRAGLADPRFVKPAVGKISQGDSPR